VAMTKGSERNIAVTSEKTGRGAHTAAAGFLKTGGRKRNTDSGGGCTDAQVEGGLMVCQTNRTKGVFAIVHSVGEKGGRSI